MCRRPQAGSTISYYGLQNCARMNVVSVFALLTGRYMVGLCRFQRFSKSALYPPPVPLSPRHSGTGHRASSLASRQHVPHVAWVPAAATRCCHASVVESVCDGLQGCGACLTHRLYDRQYCACEALGFSLASLTTAATNGIEVRVAQFYTAYLGSCQRRLSALRDQRALLPSVGRPLARSAIAVPGPQTVNLGGWPLWQRQRTCRQSDLGLPSMNSSSPRVPI
jgi:hypothetical protein